MSQSTRSLSYSLYAFRYEAVKTYHFSRQGAASVLRALRQDHGPEGARLLIRQHYWQTQGLLGV